MDGGSEIHGRRVCVKDRKAPPNQKPNLPGAYRRSHPSLLKTPYTNAKTPMSLHFQFPTQIDPTRFPPYLHLFPSWQTSSLLFLICTAPKNLRLTHTTQLLGLLGGLGAIILALDTANLVCSSLVFITADDKSRELTTLDAAGVEPFGVWAQLQAAFRVVTVDDGRTFFFREIGLVSIPQLKMKRKLN